jgi:glyoxylase-like metal-dependent hydrolase (beta-lactamase superfamily II)
MEGVTVQLDHLADLGSLCLRAGNADAWTLGGTNTWLLPDEATSAVTIIDPGPLLEAHLRSIDEALGAYDWHVAAIVVTHCHEDHADAVPSLTETWDVPVYAALDSIARGTPPVVDGDTVVFGSRALEVVHTPGHTIDSISLLDRERGVLYSGDTVLGGKPTVIDVPGGSLADYLRSMQLLRSLADEAGIEAIAPGHGERQSDVAAYLQAYLSHREGRIDQVRQLVKQGCTDAHAITDALYPQTVEELREGAVGNVRAALAFLAHEAAHVDASGVDIDREREI